MTETLVKDEVVRQRPMGPAHPSTTLGTRITDLVEYARKHRCRLRNLHDAGPVPPARRRKSDTAKLGYVGASDRWDAIVGYDGYIADEGEPGQLGIYLQYRSAMGVKRAHSRIQALGGAVKQVGDTEIAGSVPVDSIEEALRLIKVSRLRPGSVQNLGRSPAQKPYAS